jgi:Fe(3+) dicitrate transport protein
MKHVALLLAVGSLAAQATLAEDALEELTIIGSRDDVRTLPGSGALVDNEQIRLEAANDINQLLKTVPGIYIREEDGYGLRPNIGIRGATSERASKVTLMEDGVLIAPAPYSNPAAYYFPTTLRMHAVEVLKGAPLLRYGPQTTGGVLNMVSTPVPADTRTEIALRYGENDEWDLLASYGGRAGAFGFLLETVQRHSDGFKDIDRSDRGSGYDISDYLLKLGWEGARQSVLFKAQHSEETSDETYLGLSDVDFGENPNRRYGLSSIDVMDNDHQGFSLVYDLSLTDAIGLTAIAYHRSFARDWFKLSGGSAYINAANEGDAGAQAVLDGTADAFGLVYKHNDREYESRGVDVNFDIDLGAHRLAVGSRLHEDEMDRYQPDEFYDQVAGELLFAGIEAPTGSDNRIEDAEAVSFWITDAWQVSAALDVNLALRYEDVTTRRLQYATPERTDDPSRRSNDSSEWLPGASFRYRIAPEWQLLGGVHRGFSPIGGGATENQDPETSINWEAGLRYEGAWFLEAIGFLSDFENLTENCSNANPCSNGATSGSFNTGEAVIRGLELQAGATFEAGESTSVPLDLMYTYTDAAISESNPTLGFEDGDRLASIPRHTLSLRTGVETGFGWDNYTVVKYIDEMCVSVGCAGDRSSTEELFVIDLISRYRVTAGGSVYLKIENVLDEQAIVSREPDGARPNKPRTASVGLAWTF